MHMGTLIIKMVSFTIMILKPPLSPIKANVTKRVTKIFYCQRLCVIIDPPKCSKVSFCCSNLIVTGESNPDSLQEKS